MLKWYLIFPVSFHPKQLPQSYKHQPVSYNLILEGPKQRHPWNKLRISVMNAVRFPFHSHHSQGRSISETLTRTHCSGPQWLCIFSDISLLCVQLRMEGERAPGALGEGISWARPGSRTARLPTSHWQSSVTWSLLHAGEAGECRVAMHPLQEEMAFPATATY